MTTAVKMVFEDGVLKPREPLRLQEHSEVEVLIMTPVKRDPDDPTGWKAIRRLIGAGEGPADLGRNHDKDLYGDPSE